MDFKIKKSTPEKTKTDALILPVFEGATLGENGAAVNGATSNSLGSILKGGDINGKCGETLVLNSIDGISAQRVVLMGLGKAEDLNESGFRKAFSAAINAVKGTAAKDASVVIEDIRVNNRDATWLSRQIVELAEYATYTFNQFKSKDNHKNVKLKKLSLIYSAGEKIGRAHV